MKKFFAPLATRAYWKTWLSRFLTMLAPAFLLSFTLFFVGPLDITNANQAYLTFAAVDLLPTVIPMAVGCAAVLAALLAFVPGRAYRIAFAVVLGLAVLFYLQGMVLNGDLGTLDGTEFDWHEVETEAIRNLYIWLIALVVVILLGIFLPEEWLKMGGIILCAALIFAQGSALLMTWVPKDRTTPNYQLTGEDQFTFSTDKNIIVITLDQVSPLIFEEALEADPELKPVFKDFVYYNNMSSVYSFTFPSMMFLYTHEYLDTTVPTTEAVYNAWHSEGAQHYYDVLHENNYEVNLYVEANYAALGCENMIGKADNIVEAGRLKMNITLFEQIMDMSLFRYMPTMLKNEFCVSTGGIVDLSTYVGAKKMRINYDFLDSLEKEGLSLTDETNMYQWYHMQGAHFPYVVDENGYYVGEENTDRDKQLHGYLVALRAFFEELKEIGVYDDATIIVSADHGYFECFQAAFLIKLPGQEFDEMPVTTAPVAQEDILPTILYLLGEDYSDYGTTVFDWNEGDRRIRTTHVWGYMTQFPEVPWIGNMNQWDAEANGVDRYNVLGVFDYDGDRDTILEEERNWYYYGYADRILPLTDSFY